MAVKVKVGDVYTEPKTGEGSKGKYGYVTAKAEKGKDKIAIFFSNPDDIPDNAFAVEIVSIEEVAMTTKKVGETWFKNFNVTATVKATEGGASPMGLDDEGVPF